MWIKNKSFSIQGKTYWPFAVSLEEEITGKQTDHKIIARIGNLLTPKRAPEPLRFLRLIINQKYKSYRSPFERKTLENLIFVPRMRFKKTIFSPATWNLDGSNFVGKSKEDILRQFQIWANDWKLPQFSLIVQMDNHLLINREHPACLKKIVNHLKNGERIQFIEQLTSFWVKGEDGNHVSEIVIPFVKNSRLAEKQPPFSTKPYHSISFDQRWRLPGSDWMYIKCYLGKDKEEKFLTGHLSKFLKKVQAPWFFVRYLDPDPHLRVRILKNGETTSSQELANLEKVLKYWMEIGLIRNSFIAPYEREIDSS